ncbi:MAG TPA: DNA topoisomerase III [Acetivibrio sp.]|nr:DNA topoisomerase III [Acetivibrio sp.]
MGKILVLAEKPSVGRDLARVLNCKQNGGGYLMGPKYIVTWALGHLVTLADPEAYDKRYKKWDLELLPMLPDRMELVVIRKTAKQFNIVKELMRRDDVDQLVIATDSGREGELVARWIIKKAGFKKPVKRLWISSQTDRAIRDGFNSLRPAGEYDNLFKSAQCRAEADWLVGLNITRALTCKYNAQLSAGRVQTPTLAMVIERENEIKRFVPKDYWTIEADVKGFGSGISQNEIAQKRWGLNNPGALVLHWRDKKGQTRIFDRESADKIVNKVKGQNGKVVEVIREAKSEPVPLAYDLTELQRDANRIFGYSAKKTLSIMQKLYESHKLVTYPRTDSRYITEDIVPTLSERLKSIAVGPYAAAARELIKNKPCITRRFVDNSKVTDHHAIIPTEQYVSLVSLDKDERNIYDLIVKRFIAVMSRPFEYEQTTIKVEAVGEQFYAKGKIVKSLGWKAVYQGQPDSDDQDPEERDQVLPDIKKGADLCIGSVKAVNRKTKPPARYTEATLLSAMENPGKFVGDRELREILDNVSGLGTPATRADIIEKLFDSFYMERNGKEIIPTSKGMQLINLVPEDLKSPELTAKWEQQLTGISRGKVSDSEFIFEMKKYASRLVSNVIANSSSFRHDNITREKCPECGKYLLDVKGKKGKMLVCSDRECGYRKNVSQSSNARCPECHKKMELRGEGEDKTFYCVCGYRERLESFKKRKSEQVDKRDVREFLKQQESTEPINTALADALKKLKL